MVEVPVVAPVTAVVARPLPAASESGRAAPAAPSPSTATGTQEAPRQQPAPSTTAESGTRVTVSESSVDLRSLPAPVTLAARVVATQAADTIRLETALGRILVTAPGLTTEPGASLRLAVDTGGVVRLLPPQTQPATGTAGASAPATGHAIPTLAAGDVVQARLLPAAQTAPSNAAAQPPPAGPTLPAIGPTTVTVRILAIEPAIQPLLGGSQAAARPGTAQPPSLTVPAPFEATVSGRAALGQPVLNFANGTLVLDRGDLPDGARLRLEVLATARSVGPPAPSIAQLGGLLDEMMAALVAQPSLAAAVDARLPRMGPKLGSSTLFLMAALQGGGVGALVGQDAQQAMQKQGRDSLLKRLAEALSQRGSRLETEAASAGSELWRALYLPIATAHGWQPLRVAWQEPDDGQDEGGEDERARFQIDFGFSRLGPVRLDGLAGTGRLDLLLISRTAFGAESRAEIEALFGDTIAAMGLKGHIRFVEQPDLTAPAVRAEQVHPDVTV